jgi:hypothetical protein
MSNSKITARQRMELKKEYRRTVRVWERRACWFKDKKKEANEGTS